MDVQSERVSAMLVDSAGAGSAPGSATGRFGLAEADSSRLSTTALASLRGASMATDPHNGILDYDEARRSLGMAGYGFHLNVAPVGLSTQLAGLDLGGIRTGYIGKWDGAPFAAVPPGAEAVVVQEARGKVDGNMAAVAGPERAALARLGLGFSDAAHLGSTALDVHVTGDPKRHITQVASPAALQGDVMPDRKQYLTAVLPARLPSYDLLVVGSGVQHNALTADAVKAAVRDWVLAGGTLLVLGSDAQSTQWMQPLFHVGTQNVNGGAYAPHVTHPLLREPHALAWPDYGVPSRAWDIRDQGAQAGEDDFDHIIMSGAGGDLLAISRPGSFGDGRIILTAYQPGELAGLLGDAEAQAFLHNAIVHVDRSHLYLEYGALPPWGAQVGSSVRHSVLHDAELGLVPVRILVLVWREA